jgi:hypothetical protein
MKIKTHASGGASGSGMEENPEDLPHPFSRRRPPVSRADRPVRVKPQRPRLDPPSPGLLFRLPDDGDGMDQGRPHPALARPQHNPPARGSPADSPGLVTITRLHRPSGLQTPPSAEGHDQP